MTSQSPPIVSIRRVHKIIPYKDRKREPEYNTYQIHLVPVLHAASPSPLVSRDIRNSLHPLSPSCHSRGAILDIIYSGKCAKVRLSGISRRGFFLAGKPCPAGDNSPAICQPERNVERSRKWGSLLQELSKRWQLLLRGLKSMAASLTDVVEMAMDWDV
jgi:hypothetical protein